MRATLVEVVIDARVAERVGRAAEIVAQQFGRAARRCG